MKKLKLLILAIFSLIRNAEASYVLSFDANNVAEIKHSNYKENYAVIQDPGHLKGDFQDLALCFRFSTYLSAHHYLFKGNYVSFKWRPMEFHGKFRFMKTNVIFRVPQTYPRSWYHFCLSYDSKNNHTAKVVMDRTLLANISLPGLKNKTIPSDFLQNFTLGVFSDNLVHGPHYSIFRGLFNDLNIWSVPLTDQELVTFTSGWSKDSALPKPDVLSWPSVKFSKIGQVVSVKNLTLEELQQGGTVTDYMEIFTTCLTQSEAHVLCKQFGGNLFQPSGPNDADIQRAFKTWKSSQCLSDMCSKTALWTPWIRMENSTTGQAFWMNQDTLEIASYLPWAESRPDGNDIEACVVAQMSENGPMTFNDYACTFKIPFFCKTIGLLNFNLRGMCQHSNVDSQYMVPIKDLKDRCRFTFDGLGGTTMTFNDQLKRWELLDGTTINKTILGYFNGTNVRYPIGKHIWTMHHECSGQKMEPHDAILKFTLCNGTEFSCSNGFCIDIQNRCNGVNECQDGSDEEDCEILEINQKLYRKESTPIKKIGMQQDIYVDITIHKLSDFVELASKFSARLQVNLTWYDSRLKFKHLNDDFNQNQVGDEQKLVWTPKLLFRNSLDSAEILNDDKILLSIRKEKEGAQNDLSQLDESLIYEGEDNAVVLTGLYDLDLNCQFLMHAFPFDTQTCEIQIHLTKDLKSTVNLVESRIDYSRDIQLNNYEIVGVFTAKDPKKNSIQISIKLRRMFFNHIATTFLPTLCVMLIAEITLFIDESHFEATVMVALTSMLVMYTQYQSISQSLPDTAYLKMIDVWLLFGLIMPFFVFLLEVSWELTKYKTVQINSIRINVGSKNVMEKHQHSCVRSKRIFQLAIPNITIAFYLVYVCIAVVLYTA